MSRLKGGIFVGVCLVFFLILTQTPKLEARVKTGRTAAELARPQTWGEAPEDNADSIGNTPASQGSPWERPKPEGFRAPNPSLDSVRPAPGDEKSGHTLGASESMDKLFPLGTPTPEAQESQKEIKQWIHALGGESHQRQNAVERLSAAGKTAVPDLLAALKDSYAYTRVGALAALANIRDKSALPAMERLLKDRAYEVRAEAAKSLGTMKSRDSLTKLLLCLEDKEGRVRREAVIALGKLKSETARDSLISALQTTTHRDVRQQAVQELSAFSGPEAVEALLHCTHGEDLQLCVFAIRALGEIGDPAAQERLNELSQHRDRAIREEAVRALQNLE